MMVFPSASSMSLTKIATAVAAILLTRVVVLIARSIHRKMRAAKVLAPVPGPKGHLLIGMIPELVKNIHRLHDFQLADPTDVEHVLSANVNNWIRSDRMIAALGELFGKSFFALNHAHTADNGAMWRLQRKVVNRVFTTNNLKALTEGIFSKYAVRIADLVVAQGGKCDMRKVSSQYTLQTAFDIVCGVPLENFDDELGVKLIESMDYVFSSISLRGIEKPYLKYLWWCMPSEYRFRRESKVVTDLVDSILKKRLRGNEEEIANRSDLLSLFIKKARELEAESETILDTPTLRSIVASFIFAGRDTTSSAIVYSFYALAQYPREQEKILEELKTIDTSTMNVDDVKKLMYLDAFVWETMRLYPAVPANLKQAAKDDILLDGTFVPARTEAYFSAWYMGRNNAKLWGEDQRVFRPERWLSMPRRPTAYEFPVFQGGPRICPGMNMALLETKVFVAIMLQKFHVKIQEGEQVKNRPYELGPTLAMKNGLPLQFTARVSPAH